MDDFIGYIAIALFIGFTVFIEIRKKAKESENASVPQNPLHEPTAPYRSQKTKQTVDARKKGGNYTPLADTKASSQQQHHGEKKSGTTMPHRDSPEGVPNFRLTSTEEARRAIIWSEILRRKY